MRRVITFLFVAASVSEAGAQKKNNASFTMPATAKYVRGRVLVKVRSEFKDQIANLSFSKETKVKEVALHSITRMLPAGAENSRTNKTGQRLQNPRIDISKYYSLAFDTDQSVEEYINKLYATGYFEIVEPEYKYKTDFTPNDPSVTQQYYLNLINAFDAWDITKGDTAMVIAIVDTGGNLTHSDIAPNLYRNWAEYPPNGVDDDGNGFIDDYQGWDFVGSDTSNLSKPGFVGDNDPSIHIGGDVSHGTWVAGCASASTNNGIGIAGVGSVLRAACSSPNIRQMIKKQPTDQNIMYMLACFMPATKRTLKLSIALSEARIRVR
jgi:serine protease